MRTYFIFLIIMMLWGCNPLADTNSSSDNFSFSVDSSVNNQESSLSEPILSNLLPTGIVNSNNGPALLSLNTNINSRCRYDSMDKSYNELGMSFITDNSGLGHSGMMAIDSNKMYQIYIKCKSSSGAVNKKSKILHFTTNQVAQVLAPELTNLLPTGVIPRSTLQAKLELNTNVSSSCRFSEQDISYDKMTTSFYSMDNRYHYQYRNVIANNVYQLYVRCSGSSGIKNESSKLIVFSTTGIDEDTRAPIITGTLPSGSLASETLLAELRVTTNEKSICRYSSAEKSFDLMESVFNTDVSGLLHLKSVNVNNDNSYRYYVRCRDAASNTNNISSLINFNVLKKIPVDNTAPLLTGLAPTGSLTGETTMVTLSVVTNEKSNCKYSTIDNSFALMNQGLVASVNGLTHTKSVSVSSEQSYLYFVRCQDQKLNANNSSSLISFNVLKKEAVDTTSPLLSGLSPSGNLESSLTSAVLRVITNEKSTCRYSDINQIYEEMLLSLNVSLDGTVHTKSINVSNDNSYIYYVRCQDTAKNINNNSSVISFSVLKKEPEDREAPLISNMMPFGTLSSETLLTMLSVNSNEKATCRYSETDNNYDLMTLTLVSSGDGMSHSRQVSVKDGEDYKYYIRCSDDKNNLSQQSSVINFSVAKKIPVDTVAPLLSNLFPLNSVISANVTNTLIGFETNENSNCRYSMNDQQSFNEMIEMQTTGAKAHQTNISGLSNGGSYNFYVRCSDQSQNISLQQKIFFSVEGNANLTAGQSLYTNNCAGCHGALSNSRVKNTTKEQIEFAIANIAVMRTPAILALTPTNIESIALALSDNINSTPVDANKLITRLQLVERRYFDDIISRFFKLGDMEERGPITKDYLILKNTAFGGACDPYAVARTTYLTGDYLYETCFVGASVSTKDLLFSPQRASYTIRSCETYVSNTSSFQAAMASYGGVNTPWSTDVFTAIFKQFYTFETPSSAVITKFKEVFDAQNGNSDGWKAVVVGVCISPMWQVL